MSDNITEDYHRGTYSWSRIANDYITVYNNYKNL